jgi:prevent-host-death family protein
MERVTMVEFRRHASDILRKTMRGQRIILTYRGKPVVRLEPIGVDESIQEDDPIYGLAAHAEANGESLTNDQIDGIVYG